MIRSFSLSLRVWVNSCSYLTFPYSVFLLSFGEYSHFRSHTDALIKCMSVIQTFNSSFDDCFIIDYCLDKQKLEQMPTLSAHHISTSLTYFFWKISTQMSQNFLNLAIIIS